MPFTPGIRLKGFLIDKAVCPQFFVIGMRRPLMRQKGWFSL
jgi:hypothetical protein